MIRLSKAISSMPAAAAENAFVPILTLLSGAATGTVCTSHIDLAVIVELIHLATLVHDDIMDGADIRRDQATVNAKWGNTLAVLLGDCLFAHALQLAAAFPNNAICRRIAHAAKEVCSGEIIQTQRRFDLNLTIDEYFQVIEMKTAALFAVATELGAFISEASPEVITAMKAYGLKLGTAYQIYDDCLDIAGTEEKAGKTLGSDLRKGKLTLPVLYLLQMVEPEERHRFSEVLLRVNADELDGLAEEVVRRGALRRAVETTKRLVEEAQSELQGCRSTNIHWQCRISAIFCRISLTSLRLLPNSFHACLFIHAWPDHPRIAGSTETPRKTSPARR